MRHFCHYSCSRLTCLVRIPCSSLARGNRLASRGRSSRQQTRQACLRRTRRLACWERAGTCDNRLSRFFQSRNKPKFCGLVPIPTVPDTSRLRESSPAPANRSMHVCSFPLGTKSSGYETKP
jgi:hypothetical protein